MYVIPGTTKMIAYAISDDSLSGFGMYPNGTLQCLTNYTKTTGTYSLDGGHNFFYDNDTDLIYVAALNTDTLTILNATNFKNSGTEFTNVNSTTSASTLNSILSVFVHRIGTDKIAFLGTSSPLIADWGIIVYNVTNPSAPSYMGRFTDNSSACRLNQTNNLYAKDNYLYAVSGGTTTESCFYAIKLYDAEEEPPADSCTCPNSAATEWNVSMSDNCVVSGNCLCAALIFTGQGTFNYTNGYMNFSSITFNVLNSRFYGYNTWWQKR
jgi:hypothetical protein